MSSRLVSPRKRPNSSYFWFRLVVPPHLRDAVGKREIQFSLGTSDLGEARRMCAQHQSAWLAQFAAYEAQIQRDAELFGSDAVDRFFAAEASRYGGMDKVVAYELECVTEAEQAALDALTTDELGLPADADHPLIQGAYPVYRDSRLKDMIQSRREALRNGAASPISGAEAARRALSQQVWDVAIHFVEQAFAHVGRELSSRDPAFAVAAESYLRRLSTHPLPGLEALADALPVPAPIDPHARDTAAAPDGVSLLTGTAREAAAHKLGAPVTLEHEDLRELILGDAANARTISEVFEAWAATQPPDARKLVDEWRTAVRRFTQLFGDVDVALVTSDMVRSFRDAMRRMPSRPKKEIAELNVRDQIAIAREKNLRTLQGPTIAKLLSGIRVTLAHAVDPLRLIKDNPATGVSVSDATSDSDARLAFDPDDLRKIFGDDLIQSGRERLSDSEFWLLVLAPLTGARIEEMGKLRPGNIRQERGIDYIAIERDSRAVRRKEAAQGKASKRAKREASYRHVPVHWLLKEAGFLTFVERQRGRGAEWLFDDLDADKYGSRTKNVSRRLIRRIRAVGINEEEKVFYSFRHAMKRACRNTTMKEEVADLLAGHAPAHIGRKYGAGADLHVLRDALDMIEYETIDWDGVIRAARSRLSN
ncbi:MAG: DUF6538 domain-containing protein [Allosphingosinicella sp.]|uniref:DUF6538 domain-containing protein n=1 Tax=Allosphingosinicella sp. TaxID=2823234 RepID=UPI00395AD713